MSFDALALHPLIRRGIDALGFSQPTPIQFQLVPVALSGADVIGLAPTGTGKTLAYVMPLAHRLLSDPPPILSGPRKRGGKSAKRVDPRTRLRALVLVPTRELAQQVAKDASALTKGSLLRITAVWGKTPLAPHREAIARGVDLLVGTPGRIRELLDADGVSLAHIRYAVIDEADRMLDLGFLPQVDAILDRMPPQRQTLLLSATFPRMVEELAARILREPMRVESEGQSRPAPHVGQTLFEVEDAFKTALVRALVEGGKRRGVIIFVRTRRRAGWVAQALRNHGVSTGLLHGDRSQAQREAALSEFAAGRNAVLVATDVAARGLHVPAIRTVINYDLPLLPEEYVHRVGRAGHGGGFAESFTFLSMEPEEKPRWKRIERAAALELSATATPDLREWMREEDRERFDRSVVRQARSLQERDAERRERAIDRQRDEERERRRQRPEERRTTTKRAGKPKRVGRGGSAAKRIDPRERPGGGVKRLS